MVPSEVNHKRISDAILIITGNAFPIWQTTPSTNKSHKPQQFLHSFLPKSKTCQCEICPNQKFSYSSLLIHTPNYYVSNINAKKTEEW